MNTQPKPTWMTLVSLSAICIAAFFLIVPRMGHPIAQAIVSLIIAVALFDVVALWIMANREALEREFSHQDQKDTPYRYYPSRSPVTLKQKRSASKTTNKESNDHHKDL